MLAVCLPTQVTLAKTESGFFFACLRLQFKRNASGETSKEVKRI